MCRSPRIVLSALPLRRLLLLEANRAMSPSSEPLAGLTFEWSIRGNLEGSSSWIVLQWHRHCHLLEHMIRTSRSCSPLAVLVMLWLHMKWNCCMVRKETYKKVRSSWDRLLMILLRNSSLHCWWLPSICHEHTCIHARTPAATQRTFFS